MATTVPAGAFDMIRELDRKAAALRTRHEHITSLLGKDSQR
jgi:hypothetical protein